MLNPANAVVRLCAEGIALEQQDAPFKPIRLYREAWDQSQTAMERSIAAHYLARHQETPELTLQWNREALAQAASSDDENIQSFLPSLYLNLGKSHEDLGRFSEAEGLYRQALEHLNALPEGSYRYIVQQGASRASRVFRNVQGRSEDEHSSQ